MSNELIVIDKINAIEVFASGGADDILGKIEALVSDFEPDITSSAGRKEIASLAYKVAKSKVALDALGVSLVADKKAEIAMVDAERRRVRDKLDEIKVRVRKPLTEWEDAEVARVKVHNDCLAAIKENTAKLAAGWGGYSAKNIASHLEGLRTESRDWEEFKHKAGLIIGQSITETEACLARRIDSDKRDAELAELKAAAALKAKEDHEKLIAEKAANVATLAAEAGAAKVRLDDEVAAQKKQDELRAKVEKERADALAEADAEKAVLEKQRLAAEAKVEELIAAQKKKDDEIAAANAAAAKIAANKKHQAEINGAAKNSLIAMGIDESDAKKIIIAIVKKEIKNISINY
jgi:hypothetical protein